MKTCLISEYAENKHWASATSSTAFEVENSEFGKCRITTVFKIGNIHTSYFKE